MLNLLAFLRPGLWEILIILVIVLIVFGANKLPKIGSALGEAIRGFRKSVKDDEGQNIGGEADKPSEPRPE